MTEAVENYVHKDDKKAIENYLKLALDLLKVIKNIASLKQRSIYSKNYCAY